MLLREIKLLRHLNHENASGPIPSNAQYLCAILLPQYRVRVRRVSLLQPLSVCVSKVMIPGAQFLDGPHARTHAAPRCARVAADLQRLKLEQDRKQCL